MLQDVLKKEKQLQSELEGLRELKAKAQEEEQRQKNYKDWLERKPLWLLGKAYCAPYSVRSEWNDRPLKPLGISITVPGNCSRTYEVSPSVPAAVVVYFHNLFTEEMRSELYDGFEKVIKKVIGKFLGNPACVLDMLGLQSDKYYLERSDFYPKEHLESIEEEINEERFNVIDQFKESELIGIIDSLHHSRSILYEYAKSRNLKLLIKDIQSKCSWAN